MGILLRLIQILIKDFEDYLSNKVEHTKIKMPNTQMISMKELNEQYIFGSALEFIKATLVRKKYDVGSVELKFYVLVKVVATSFYHATDIKHKLAVYELVFFIHSTDHQKYLDNVNHPAKKSRKNAEIVAELMQYKQTRNEGNVVPTTILTNSNKMS